MPPWHPLPLLQGLLHLGGSADERDTDQTRPCLDLNLGYHWVVWGCLGGVCLGASLRGRGGSGCLLRCLCQCLGLFTSVCKCVRLSVYVCGFVCVCLSVWGKPHCLRSQCLKNGHVGSVDPSGLRHLTVLASDLPLAFS